MWLGACEAEFGPEGVAVGDPPGHFVFGVPGEDMGEEIDVTGLPGVGEGFEQGGAVGFGESLSR